MLLVQLPLTQHVWQVHMTVSHFNLIHVNCHAAARRADSSLRVAKREWEGATLRNGGTLANNLLPVSDLASLDTELTWSHCLRMSTSSIAFLGPTCIEAYFTNAEQRKSRIKYLHQASADGSMLSWSMSI